MDSAVKTALDVGSYGVFYAMKIEASGFTLRLLDGPGAFTLDSEAYAGADATYGALELPASVADGLSSESPTLDFGLLPPSDEAAALLLAGLEESSLVTLWGIGVFNLSTGAMVGTPEVLFSGYVESAKIEAGDGTSRIGVEAVGGFHRFLDRGDGVTMSDATHQSFYPGELGLAFMDGVGRSVYWGQAAPANLR